ncbi:hypothetical protein SAMN02744102_02118, partial [Paenibacillus barengoltzii]
MYMKNRVHLGLGRGKRPDIYEKSYRMGRIDGEVA